MRLGNVRLHNVMSASVAWFSGHGVTSRILFGPPDEIIAEHHAIHEPSSPRRYYCLMYSPITFSIVDKDYSAISLLSASRHAAVVAMIT